MPEEVTSELVLEWRAHILNTKIKAISWNCYARHLATIFTFAIENNLITHKKNPFSGVTVRAGISKRKTISQEALNKIRLLLDSDELCNILKPVWFIRAIIFTFQYTGIRRAQLLRLKIENVNLTKRVIFIEGESNKNHHDHVIPIPDVLYPHLADLVKKMKMIGQPNDSQLFNYNLFCRYTKRCGLPMNESQLSNIFDVISQKIGVRVSPHRFRHTIATNLMKDPENVYVVQKLLGHKNIKITLSYIEYDVELIRNKINALM